MSDPTQSITSHWLEIGGALAAIGSAIYAGCSANSARRQAKAAEATLRESSKQSTLIKTELAEMRLQNDISLHSPRLEVYRVFTDLRFELKARTWNFDRNKLSAYYAQVQLAEFYFPLQISTALSSTIDKILYLRHLADNVSDPQGADSDELKNTRDSRNALYTEIDNTFDTLDTDIKKVLRLPQPGV